MDNLVNGGCISQDGQTKRVNASENFSQYDIAEMLYKAAIRIDNLKLKNKILKLENKRLKMQIELDEMKKSK